MTNALTKKDELAALVKSAHGYADATITPGVRHEYGKTFARLVKWCAEMGGLPSLPSDPQTVVLYFTALADGLVRVDWEDGDGHAKSHQRKAKISYIRRVYTAVPGSDAAWELTKRKDRARIAAANARWASAMRSGDPESPKVQS